MVVFSFSHSLSHFLLFYSLTEPKVDLLINNAGVMCHPEAKTEDGLEHQFSVNYLGKHGGNCNGLYV